MNKIISFLKGVLIILNIIFMFLFMKNNGLNVILLTIPFIFLTGLTIKDVYQKQKLSNRFNVLVVLVLFINLLLFIRGNFEQNFIPNSIYSEINGNNITYNFDLYFERNNFILQNTIYILILYGSLLLYRYTIINKDLTKKRYSKVIISCLLINLCLSLNTLKYFSVESFSLLFFAINTILLTVEIVSLIRNNGLKKEWPIYICFFFNLFAYIAILT